MIEFDATSLPARSLRCPCGVLIEAKDDDELVERANAHLVTAHPGRQYTREEILFFAL